MDTQTRLLIEAALIALAVITMVMAYPALLSVIRSI